MIPHGKQIALDCQSHEHMVNQLTKAKIHHETQKTQIIK